MQSYDKTV